MTVAFFGVTGWSATVTTTGAPAGPADAAVPLFVTHMISVLTQLVGPLYVLLLLNWGLASEQIDWWLGTLSSPPLKKPD